VGNLVLVAGALFVVAGVLTPAVARPAGRVLAALASGLVPERDEDLVIAVDDLRGLATGLPVFLPGVDGAARPVAHVVSWQAAADGAGGTVRLRFEPGEDPSGPWRLRAYPPERTLGAALAMAVTPEAAGRFGAEVAARVERLWSQALLPEARQRMPGFLARVDPTADTEARALLDGATASVVRRLAPLTEDLSETVVGAMKREFDLLDRLGLLFKLLRNDAAGLQRTILPVAREASVRWWAAHRDDVLRAVGDGLGEHLGALRDWAGGELFDATRHELIEPILAAQRERLESEGEGLLRRAADEFVEAHGGGFRIRFTGLLRTQVLGKRTALLLLERAHAAER
jgi:hypothetical protein